MFTIAFMASIYWRDLVRFSTQFLLPLLITIFSGLPRHGSSGALLVFIVWVVSSLDLLR
ncbi:hypothetical protein BD626DRAFT_529737 [Schizophyllum amplum]|uniref:Uncharacterized protein n=1 Tax=Schizophyllum amplum TaxID=97359 RepID=A0A550BRU3_9AGAR|nr:hypothetical protein BD626DRAFT_529737 [Auriculariopsis ampla]